MFWFVIIFILNVVNVLIRNYIILNVVNVLIRNYIYIERS